MLRRAAASMLALSCAAALAGCDSGGSHRATGPRPTAPIPVTTPAHAPATQTGWLHGVAVDVPAGWPRNKLRCGTSYETSLIVLPAGAAFPACAWAKPKTLRPDVVWLAGFVPPLTASSRFLGADLPPGGLAKSTAVTINGEPARELQTRDNWTKEPAVLVVLPRRAVYVVVSSMHRTIRDSVVASIRFARRDAITGCLVRTSAYDAPPRHPHLDGRIDVSGAVSVSACHYVAGWLETTAASMPAAKLAALMRAIDAAPHVTSARAPVDRGCEGLAPGPPEWSDDGPVVLRFSFADGTSRIVVARVVECTRWQSYVFSGSVERRMTGALLAALPPVLVQFPGIDTM